MPKGLKDRKKKVRPITVEALSKIGPKAKDALPALYKALGMKA